MDNLTHSLAGFASVEVINAWKPQKRNVYISAQITAVVANNFPDLDMLYTGVTPGKLGYLIHHRGHTHTLLLATLFSLLVGYLGVALLKRRSGEVSRSEKFFLYSIAVLGGFLHIFMDSWNTYGVHPLWPFSNRWFYGDAIFIVEPILWVTLLPLVITGQLSKGFKLLGAVTLLAVFGVIVWTGYLLTPVAVLLFAWSALLIYLSRKLRYRTAVCAAVFSSALCVFSFVVFSRYLEHKVALQTPTGTFIIDDIVLSPLPANPFCWTLVIAFQDKATGEVGMRRGILTPFSWVPYSSCPRLRGNASTAPLKAFKDESGLAVTWGGEVRFKADRFKELAETNCYVGGYLRMSRAPFVIEEAESLVLGDLRFDWEESLGFSEMRVPRKITSCPKWVAPWVPPRADWLSRS